MTRFRSSTMLEKNIRTINDYLQYLGELTKDRPAVYSAYEELRASLRILKEDIAYFAKRDKRGNYPVVREEDRQRLLDRYNLVFDQFTKLESRAADEKERMPAVFYEINLKIIKALTKDQKVLLIQEKDLTLPQMAEKLKNVVDMTKIYGNAVHGQASERMAVQIVSGTGKDRKFRKGFFTKNQVRNQKIQFDEHYALYNTESNLKKCFADLQEIGGPSFSIKDFFEDVRILQKKDKKTLELGEKYGRSAQSGEFAEWLHHVLQSETTNKMVINFAQKTQDIKGIDHTMGKHAGIAKNSVITLRNCAMSDVAHLLQMDSLLAHSEPMTVLTKDGLQEGVFMDLAIGSDPRNLAPDDPMWNIDARMYHKGNETLKKAAADLQVLDFLCGNIDRHCENFTYITDKKNGKFVNIQGFDNDMSFGKVPQEYLTGKIRYQNFTGLKDFRFITETTAEKLKNLTRKQLMEALQKYPLSEDEVEAACKRLEMLKNALDPLYQEHPEKFNDLLEKEDESLLLHPEGKVYVLPDEFISKLDIRKDLAVAEVQQDGSVKQANLFARIDDEIKNVFYSNEARRQEKEHPQSSRPDRLYEKAEIMSEPAGVKSAEFQEKFRKNLELLKQLNKGAFIGSKEYDNVLSYAEIAAEEFQRIWYEGEDPQTYRRQIAENLSVLAEIYLDKKIGDGTLKKQRSSNRYHAVEELLQLCTSLSDPSESPENQYRRMSYLQRTGAYKRVLNSKRTGEMIQRIRNAQKQGNHGIADAEQSFAIAFDAVGREGWKNMIADYRSELALLHASMDPSGWHGEQQKILSAVPSLNKLRQEMGSLEKDSEMYGHNEEGMERMKEALKQIAGTAENCLQEFYDSRQAVSEKMVPVLMNLHRIIHLAENAEDCHAAPSQEYETKLAGKLIEKLMIRDIRENRTDADLREDLHSHETISSWVHRKLADERFLTMTGSWKSSHLQQLYEQEDRMVERWQRACQKTAEQERRQEAGTYRVRK